MNKSNRIAVNSRRIAGLALLVLLFAACASTGGAKPRSSWTDIVKAEGGSVWKDSDASGSWLWLGEKAEISLPRPSGDLRVSFSLPLEKWRVTKAGDTSRVEVSVEGKAAFVLDAGDSRLGYFEIAKERMDSLAPAAAARIRIEFASSGSFVPKDLGENSDSRALSLKLSGIETGTASKRPLIRMLRDDILFDHAYACGFEDMLALRAEGYGFEGTMVFLSTGPGPGLEPVYAMVHARTKDNSIVAGQAAMKAALDSGYRQRRLLGYARDSAAEGFQPVYGLSIDTNAFFTVSGEEALTVSGWNSARYDGIAFWGEAMPDSEYKPLNGVPAVDHGRNRDLPGFAAEAGLPGEPDAAIFASWWNGEGPDFLAVEPSAEVAGRKAFVLRTPGSMSTDQVLSLRYSGLEPNKPVRIRLAVNAELGEAQGACWLRIGAVSGLPQFGERTPALAWYDGEGRWDGRSTEGWKNLDFVPVVSDGRGRITLCFNFQNWSSWQPQVAQAAVSGIRVETAPPDMPLTLKLNAPSLAPDSGWQVYAARSASLGLSLSPDWGDAPDYAIESAAKGLRFEVLDNGAAIAPDAGGRLALAPGMHGLRIVAKAPGCIDSFLPFWTEARYAVGDFGDNMLFNGDFSLGDAGWTYYANDGDEAKYSFENGGVAIAVTKSGHPGEDWHTQLSTRVENIALLPKATYKLSFFASSDRPRSLDVALSEWGRDLNGNKQEWDSYISKLGKVQLSETEAYFEETFVMNDQGDDRAYFAFKTGHEIGAVRIRDARLIKAR